MIGAIFRFFSGLRGKLILTYTLVTVSALLALEILVFLVIGTGLYLVQTDPYGYISDVILVLGPQAQDYLATEPADIVGLQGWLEGVAANGYASLPPQDWMDSPAAALAAGQPLYVISPDGDILAQAPQAENSLVGRFYSPPDFAGADEALGKALNGRQDPQKLYAVAPDGNYFVAVPVMGDDLSGSTVLGVIVLMVQPPPSILAALGPAFVGIVLLTGALLLLAVSPFGALFGLVMSRSLTRRLDELSQSAEAYRQGDFSRRPSDRSSDEIGQLGRRLDQMAQEIQSLLRTRQQLAVSEERNRLARDLHDTVKQQVFAIQMQLRAAKNMLERDPQKTGQHLEEAERLVRSAQQELGLMIAELRPAALESQGIAAALKAYLENWKAQTGIEVQAELPPAPPLPLTVEQALYRIAQEGLANVARHSRAGHVRVSLAYSNRTIQLEILDDGRGFDRDLAAQSGFGLESMSQRASQAGGRIIVESQPGKGTLVRALLPMTKERESNG